MALTVTARVPAGAARLLLLAGALTAALLPAACKREADLASAAQNVPLVTSPTAPPSGPGGSVPSLAPMLARVSPAVVNISVDSTETTAANPLLQDPYFRRFFNVPDRPLTQRVHAVGSGVVYDAKQGYVVTNRHLIENATNIRVTLNDRRELKATLVGSDPQTDLAVLRIPATNLTAIPLGDSSRLRVGDYVVAIGDPFGVGQTATFGIVSAVERSGLGIEGYENFIQTDASINPGNSGGALVNVSGELVGINTAILSATGGNIGIGFATPVNQAKGVIDQLVKRGRVVRGQLGVIVQDVTPDIAEAMRSAVAEGALVSQVRPGSPAAQAGIKPGDVVVALNGNKIATSAQLRNTVGSFEPGTQVRVDLRRGTQALSLTAKLVPAEAEGDQKSAPATPSDSVAGLALAPVPQGHPSYGKGGALITDVEPGSAAENEGLQAGDVILSIDQRPVANAEDAMRMLRQKRERPLLLGIQRGDVSVFVAIR